MLCNAVGWMIRRARCTVECGMYALVFRWGESCISPGSANARVIKGSEIQKVHERSFLYRRARDKKCRRLYNAVATIAVAKDSAVLGKPKTARRSWTSIPRMAPTGAESHPAATPSLVSLDLALVSSPRIPILAKRRLEASMTPTEHVCRFNRRYAHRTCLSIPCTTVAILPKRVEIMQVIHSA